MKTILQKTPNQKAFTLIELLVVISIIGLLSSVVLASVNGARAKGSIAAGQKFDSHTHSAFFDDLVLEWDFDNSIVGNIVQDRSGNGNDLQMSVNDMLKDTPKLFSTGKVIALSSTQTASIASVKSYPTTGSFSVSFWVNPSSDLQLVDFINYGPYSLFNDVTGNGTWKVAINNPSQGFAFNYNPLTGNAQTLNTGRLQPGQWHQIVTVCSGSKIGVYINGKITGSTISVPDCFFANKPLSLSNGSALQSFYLDNVRIYKQALPLSFIQEQYLAELPEFRSLAKNVRQEEKN